MEPTRIQRDNRRALTPIVSGRAETRALERAPTLLNATSLNGQVRVWAPSRLRLYLPVLRGTQDLVLVTTVALWAIPLIAIFSMTPYMPFLAAAIAAVGVLYLLLVLPAALRPCYLTTDDYGIGLTTWRGSRAIRWADIRSVEIGILHTLELGVLAHGAGTPYETIGIDLAGYPQRTRDELIRLIAHRSRLFLRPGSSSLYLGSYSGYC